MGAYITSITWINNTLDIIGNSALVISLLAVGASLEMMVFKKQFQGVMACSAIKLIILPIVVVSALYALGFDTGLILVCMIYAGSPCSSNAVALTEAMGGDSASMSVVISAQTVLSMITLSSLLYIFTSLFGTITATPTL